MSENHRWARILAFAVVFAAGLGVAVFGGSGSAANCHAHHGQCPTTSTTTTTTPKSGGYTHVVWVVMENHAYSQIIGNLTSAPYINTLARTYGNATNMYAESHPSLPNYIAMTSGSTQGITDDSGPSSHPLNVANIFTQLGTGARALEESMPSNCYKSDSGNYAVRHDPAVYYTNFAQCSTQVVPLGPTPDLSAKFTFITPNLCHDMHSNSCSGSSDVILQGDRWLQSFVPQLLATPAYVSGTTLVFITWDEDNTCSGCNNHVPTIVISPTTKGITSATTFNHYSMLRTTEEILGLPLIGGAASATSMRAAFGL
jgi:phosphatidylinositol-3-phosphatase